MNNGSNDFVKDLFSQGKIEVQNETPASCFLGTTCTSYDLSDVEEYGKITGKEVTLDEILSSLDSDHKDIQEIQA